MSASGSSQRRHFPQPGSKEEFKTNATASNSSNSSKSYNWQKNVVVRHNMLSSPKPAYSSSNYIGKSYSSRPYKFITLNNALSTKLYQSLESLARPTRPFQDMLDLIRSQVPSGRGGLGDISLLEHFLKSLPDHEKEVCQLKVFPEIIKLVLNTSTIFANSEGPQMLAQGQNETRTLTREQCSCLLAHMFLCTTLKQSSSLLPSRYDFSELYSTAQVYDKSLVRIQKIACLYNYFKKATTSAFDRQEKVTFSRVRLDEKLHGICDPQTWVGLKDILKEVEIDPKSKIEDTQNAIEVDFANKHLGGGVLGSGSVQEEIQFITRPEQLIGLLLCESLTDKEAILIRGAKIYSGYTGYANTFAFDAHSPFSKEDDRDGPRREVVAIDAKDFSSVSELSQFTRDNILRDLNKAYVGFYREGNTEKKPISTGKWGCGCFKGDPQLKFLLQWIAATRAGRHMVYHPMDTKNLSGFQTIVKMYQGQSIGKLLGDIVKQSAWVTPTKDLFSLLLSVKDYMPNRPQYY